MFNLIYYQVVVQLCTTLTVSECDQIIQKYSTEETIVGSGFKDLGSVMAFVLNIMDKCKQLQFDITDTPLIRVEGSSNPSACTTTKLNLHLMEQQLQKYCLPFLRIAALLRHHLYEKELPEIKTSQLEFVRLVYYMDLVTEGMDWDSFNAAKALCFIPGNERTQPKYWCDQLMQLTEINSTTDQIKPIVELVRNQYAMWQQPKLLGLPREYEKLFTVSTYSFNTYISFKLIFCLFSTITKRLALTAIVFRERVPFAYCVERLSA